MANPPLGKQTKAYSSKRLRDLETDLTASKNVWIGLNWQLNSRNPTVTYGWNTVQDSTRCLKNCQPNNWSAKTYATKQLPSLTGKYDKCWQVSSTMQQHRKKARNCPTVRSIPVKAALHTLSPNFDIGPFLEWVSKDKAGGYHLVLQRGEPSRLFNRSITQEVNWPLFVLARLQTPPTGIQIYQDKGPKVRHKGKGKGNKGKGKGVKGKGKHNKGGKAAKGGAAPMARAADAMDAS